MSAHKTRKGPGRRGRKETLGQAGTKIKKRINMGMCGLRNDVGAAGRLALEGELGLEAKKRRLMSERSNKITKGVVIPK